MDNALSRNQEKGQIGRAGRLESKSESINWHAWASAPISKGAFTPSATTVTENMLRGAMRWWRAMGKALLS